MKFSLHEKIFWGGANSTSEGAYPNLLTGLGCSDGTGPKVK